MNIKINDSCTKLFEKRKFFFLLRSWGNVPVRVDWQAVLNHFQIPFFWPATASKKSLTLIAHLEVNCSLICNSFVVVDFGRKISEVCVASVAYGLQRHSCCLDFRFDGGKKSFLHFLGKHASDGRRFLKLSSRLKSRIIKIYSKNLKLRQTQMIEVLGWREIIYLNYWLRNFQVSERSTRANKNLIDGFCGDTSKERWWSEGTRKKSKNSASFVSFYQSMNNLSSDDFWLLSKPLRNAVVRIGHDITPFHRHDVSFFPSAQFFSDGSTRMQNYWPWLRVRL